MNATRLTVASFNKMAQDDFRGGRVLALVRPHELSKIDASNLFRALMTRRIKAILLRVAQSMCKARRSVTGTDLYWLSTTLSSLFKKNSFELERMFNMVEMWFQSRNNTKTVVALR
jgi:ribosome biogenesis protein Nip4